MNGKSLRHLPLLLLLVCCQLSAKLPQPGKDSIAIVNQLALATMINTIPDCANVGTTKTVVYQAQLGGFDFAAQMSKNLLTYLRVRKYTVSLASSNATAENDATYNLIIAPEQTTLKDSNNDSVSGYGIYSKAQTIGYLSYRISLQDAKTKQIVSSILHTETISLPDSKLLPKYSKCPMYAIGMPREDLRAYSKWLQFTIIPDLKKDVLVMLQPELGGKA